MTVKLNNADYIVEAKISNDSVDITSVTNPQGQRLDLPDTELNAIADDILRGKFETIEPSESPESRLATIREAIQEGIPTIGKHLLGKTALMRGIWSIRESKASGRAAMPQETVIRGTVTSVTGNKYGVPESVTILPDSGNPPAVGWLGEHTKILDTNPAEAWAKIIAANPNAPLAVAFSNPRQADSPTTLINTENLKELVARIECVDYAPISLYPGDTAPEEGKHSLDSSATTYLCVGLEIEMPEAPTYY